jgi:hypothetical protein
MVTATIHSRVETVRKAFSGKKFGGAERDLHQKL